jgi:hypothetical protein
MRTFDSTLWEAFLIPPHHFRTCKIRSNNPWILLFHEWDWSTAVFCSLWTDSQPWTTDCFTSKWIVISHTKSPDVAASQFRSYSIEELRNLLKETLQSLYLVDSFVTENEDFLLQKLIDFGSEYFESKIYVEILNLEICYTFAIWRTASINVGWCLWWRINIWIHNSFNNSHSAEIRKWTLLWPNFEGNNCLNVWFRCQIIHSANSKSRLPDCEFQTNLPDNYDQKKSQIQEKENNGR